MILGESRILGQGRVALTAASESSSLSSPVSRLFHGALRTGRRVREDTHISRNALSVSYAGVQLAQRFLDTLSGLSGSIWTVMTGYLGDDSEDYGGGRGWGGRDYLDFLDGWLCHQQGHIGDDNSEGLRGNFRGIHQFPYDFPTSSSD